MKIVESIIQGLLYLSMMVTAIITYLNINKLWSRKHDPVVAESISVACNLLSVISTFPFVLDFLLKTDFSNASNFLLMCVNDGFYVLIGIGFWVRGSKRTSLWQKFWRSLRQEKSEAGNLVKALVKPTGEQQLLAILHRLAWLDDRLDEQERQYIEAFTETWEIDTKDILVHRPPETGAAKFQYLRQAVKEYLKLEPPNEQVEMFDDLVKTLIAADKVITLDEELIAAEIAAMVNHYMHQGPPHLFGIIVHPEQEQETSILVTLPEAEVENLLGDRAFLAGTFHTRRYAEIISESYREQGWFTVVHEYAMPT